MKGTDNISVGRLGSRTIATIGQEGDTQEALLRTPSGAVGTNQDGVGLLILAGDGDGSGSGGNIELQAGAGGDIILHAGDGGAVLTIHSDGTTDPDISGGGGGGGGGDPLTAIANAMKVTMGSVFTQPVLALDPSAQRLFITSAPVPDSLTGTDGTGIGAIVIDNGVGGDSLIGGTIEIDGGNAIGETLVDSVNAGGVFIRGGEAVAGSSGAQSGDVSIGGGAPGVAGNPVSFTILDGGSGYTDGTYIDLTQGGHFVFAGDSGQIYVTKFVVSGGAITSASGIYDVYTEGNTAPGDVYTFFFGEDDTLPIPVYPHMFSGTPATCTVTAVSVDSTGGSVNISAGGATISLAGSNGTVSIIGPLNNQIITLDASGDVSIAANGGAVMGLGADGSAFMTSNIGAVVQLPADGSVLIGASPGQAISLGTDGSIAAAPVGGGLLSLVPIVSRDAVNDGDTVTMTNATVERLQMTGAYAALTVVMPTSPQANQQCAIVSNHAVATLTLSISDASSIENPPASLVANTQIIFMFNVESTVWERLQ